MFENSVLLSLPVAFFAIRPLVMLLLAFCEPDIELHAALAPVQVQRYEGVSLTLDRTDEAVEFLAVKQQFPGTCRVCLDVR